MGLSIVIADGRQVRDMDMSGIEALGALTMYEHTPPELLIPRACEADVLLVNKVRVTREAMERLPRLRYIGVLATGYDNVDIACARERGIVVTNVPGYSTDSVAQLVFALLLELCHHAGEHSRIVTQEQGWARQPYYSFWQYPLIELAGKTMGIIGMGAIGRRTAQIARAFGMRVLYFSRSRAAGAEGCEWAELDELLAQSDVVSIHCPLTRETRGMMDASALARMKRTAFLINTSRGGVIVEADLRRALEEGVIAGAAVDVLSEEPPREDNPLLGAPGVVITPHIAWATAEARTRLVRVVGENIARWLDGAPQNVVT